MKRLIAILFVILFVFNLFGYKALFYYLQTQSDQAMQESLDKYNYSDKDLITIKVPLSLPYSNNWSEFERYDGSIEVEGQHYSYVKRKVFNDTLILLCIPNHEQNRLSNAQNDYEKLVNNGQAPKGNKTNNLLALLKALTADYKQDDITYQHFIATHVLPFYKTVNNNTPLNPCIASPWQPPDAIS